MNGQAEEIDLFSFVFENVVTEEMIENALKEVVAAAKKSGNSHSFHIYRHLSRSTANLLPDLQSRGFLKVWDNGRMCDLKTEYRDWHNPAEVAAEYRKKTLDLIASGMNAYDLMAHRNTISGPGINEAVEEVRIELFTMLGINHARSNQKALGYSIDPQRRKNKAMIADIHENTKHLSDWRAVKSYFDQTRFEEIGYDEKPHYVSLSPTSFKLICLAQSDSIKDVQLLVPYFGCSFVRYKQEGQRIIYLNGEIEQVNPEEMNAT
ncbi:hypothetical protein [Bacillus sp. FJAT-28004]|uniref:hypothetical protein n=1 Tax=Bacillus sp. FJAT-28004 TaxID=1679165 RepID=UPI0006B5C286|nr:hypothetical protein [Bacillus sp. FJAT-28004]